MFKKILFLSCFFWGFNAALAQDSKVVHRVILIGDAGELNTKQFKDLAEAAKQVIPNRTTVLYLGDNIYPTGMGLPGTEAEEIGRKILRSQYEPMRKAGAAVYFVPGNHDWDRSGPKGLEKIKAQSNFLNGQNDALLKLLPANGCPDPVAIPLSNEITVIAYDSEWWLYPFPKTNPEGDCDCNTKEDVLMRMKLLMQENKDKIILLAAHHPFKSYGSHGGYFTWQNHLFPLRVLNKSLWIPLPIIGSLYPFLRSTFLSPEDLKHPKYKEMVKSIYDVFDQHPNVIYAAGHEHGLQLIKDNQFQLVSGSGAKSNPNKQGEFSLFNSEKQGYVIADVLANKEVRLAFYLNQDTGVVNAFSYTKSFNAVKPSVNSAKKVVLTDSVTITISADLDSVGKFHRLAFGENYRKEYAQPVKVPVLRLSQIKGGLKVVKLGGGNQSRSLRLVDKEGKEWALRSVMKYPDVLLPEALRQTFALDILKDNLSAQHPFSALIVPVLANAVGVPHSNPVVGWVSPDDALGPYASIFENTLCLLEEREPLGDSDNTLKMLEKLAKDNDNQVNAALYLKAKALDVLISDWDRHDDQWRWKVDKTSKGNHYTSVPRDRDQAFVGTDGFIQKYVQSSSLLPMIQGYNRNIKNINWFLWEGRELNSKVFSNISEQEWDKIVAEFCADLNDEVFERALRKLPEPSYSLRREEFLAQLQLRKKTLPKMMNDYYHFFNRVVDIELTDKNESVSVIDAENKGLKISVKKISKTGALKDEIYNRVFDPKITKEIRVYLRNGQDSLALNYKNKAIKLRVISGSDQKVFNINQYHSNAILYAKNQNDIYEGAAALNLHKKISNDTANTAYIAKELYSRSSTLLNAGYNYDDGLLLGLSFKLLSPGFRKSPYASIQNVSFLHAFATSSFNFKYKGEWLNTLGKADFVLKAAAFAPNNSQNFFGFGNASTYDRDKEITYYRSRFNLYKAEAFLRYRNPKSTFSVGPSFEHYKFIAKNNIDRFISQSSGINSPDSLWITKDKMYAGLQVNYINNTRNNELLPTLGTYVDFKAIGQKGLNSSSKDFIQFTGEINLYKNLDPGARFVLTNRTGGGFTIGKPSFYQALYLGGQGNLLGYRQFRFSGLHSLYNNLELRIKLADFMSYILPGQLGLLTSYDIGRVWSDHDLSNKWHQGYSAGAYFAPASMTVIRLVMGKGSEGWNPYFSIGFRF